MPRRARDFFKYRPYLTRRCGTRTTIHTRLQVKALKRALKCVPSSLDKNERFQTVSTLVEGGRSKKECYSKYKVRRDRKTKSHGMPLAAARTCIRRFTAISCSKTRWYVFGAYVTCLEPVFHVRKIINLVVFSVD